jgi:predicted nuclease of restriction endonuclease-like (RecB) superfamily
LLENGEAAVYHSPLCVEIRTRVFSPSFLACKSASVTREAQEREIERGLLIHLRDLLLELGRGFAFVGSQA